ncbi:hypothetical protein PHLGIDRAFT_118905 [Phlebiopsis gigantea 11061_1 CR5-6]|uniref:Uncharacterized protein n=1 Tax=Phlebiopsis gigantea (strain 11061_1 CR5-6) TaxID=745531 RepID=A0A0C3RXE4_PHLG1|nr:hypothetical protein PHLGIDRAFT_118905 [Phlebiopsis gigantea 11061_1 CR5-6]
MIVNNKDAPPQQTHRAQYDAPQGPPPGYQQGSTSPFASRGYPPSPNHSSSPGGEVAPSYRQHPEPIAEQQPLGLLHQEREPCLLNPPPPAFARSPQAQLPYTPFAPCVAVSLTAGLDGGFPLMPPPGAVPGAPHPFATHDVNEEDWTRFLGDLKKIGTLSPTNRIVASVAPLAMGVGFFPGFLITRALEGRMKTKKLGPASQLVDYWNNVSACLLAACPHADTRAAQYYFHPRMMEVSLIRGRTVYGSSGGLPQEMVHQGYRRREDFDSDSSSSSSSDSEDDRARRHMSRDERRAEKREHRDERRAEKREHRDERREARRAEKGPWRLVVSYRPPTTM